MKSSPPPLAADPFESVWTSVVQTHWPDQAQSLGARLGDFIRAARQKAVRYQLLSDEAVARYLNLCLAFGPKFEDRPDNEWALALLLNDALSDWTKVHQLVVRATPELTRRKQDAGRLAAQMLRADAAFMDAHDVARFALDADAPALARIACDIDAVDIRLLEMEWRHEYGATDFVWQPRAATTGLYALRIGAGAEAPDRLSILSHTTGAGGQARLQVRLLMHAQCDQDTHPALSLAGPRGLEQWHGHQARAISMPMVARPAGTPVNGMGLLLLDETHAEITRLTLQCCGLRDAGVPSGTVRTWLWCYPADQYLFRLERSGQMELRWPQSPGAQPEPQDVKSVCQCAHDGKLLATPAWQEGFEAGLHRALEAGLSSLFYAWQAAVENASGHALVGLLNGQASLTWGWCESASGLAHPPLLRVAAKLDWSNLIDVEMAGDIKVGSTQTRLRLRLKGAAPFVLTLMRDQGTMALMDDLKPIASQLRVAFEIECDPVAVLEAAVISDISACTGALTCEFGLRPRSMGGGGWQWHVRLQTSPVTVNARVHDPVLGQTRMTLPLLPALSLVDWSLG